MTHALPVAPAKLILTLRRALVSASTQDTIVSNQVRDDGRDLDNLCVGHVPRLPRELDLAVSRR